MSSDRAALVALLTHGGRPWPHYAELVEQAGSAVAVLDRELSEQGGQTSLLAVGPEPMIALAQARVDAWEAGGLRMLTVLDAEYPANLRQVHDRPPLIFVAGSLAPADDRAVAVIGSRRASDAGLGAASAIAAGLVAAGHVVISGLAAGVDTAAHRAALAAGGRTLAVIGTGLAHAYPPENAALQRRLAAECAVVSQFWPDAPPTRRSFPMRNAVMSGLARATVVVQASPTSGARVQARLALAHGRPVLLLRPLLDQPWARELAERPGVHVAGDVGEITEIVERLDADDGLSA